MYDGSEREVIRIDTPLFFETLIDALETYLKTLETETSLEQYFIKWNWNMVDTLRNNYLKRITNRNN